MLWKGPAHISEVTQLLMPVSWNPKAALPAKDVSETLAKGSSLCHSLGHFLTHVGLCPTVGMTLTFEALFPAETPKPHISVVVQS